MAFVIQPQMKDSRSASLNLDLPSNNPFRNRATSPNGTGLPSPLKNSAPPRPVSRNPFLDASPDNLIFPSPPAYNMVTDGPSNAATRNPLLAGNAADIFDELSLEDRQRRPAEASQRPVASRSTTEKGVSGSRPENLKPGFSRHRPTKSQEDALRTRRIPNGPSRTRPSNELDIFADPSESARRSGDRSRQAGEKSEPRERRPRRNSDTSILERKPLDPEEEKKRQERRRRERERRRREDGGKDKDGKPKKPSRKLDVIDQLDATSIYGTGLFHHDGPFDACNPHRNKQGRRNAPMQAFPKDSLNNVIGGSGPVNKRPDHATFLGNNDDEAFKDYHRGAERPQYVQPSKEPLVESFNTKFEPVHGDESMGLGTSTFLEGAPASRKAMARRETDEGRSDMPGGGLQRKKSLAQKIRGISSARREFGPSGRITSPEGVYSPASPDAAGPSRIEAEKNPFFKEYEAGKGDTITIVEPANRPTRARAPSSPGTRFERLERSTTGDSGLESPKEESKPMGFLSRVKSLKGGPRKPKTDQKIPAPGPAM